MCTSEIMFIEQQDTLGQTTKQIHKIGQITEIQEKWDTTCK